jgi:hypothetical protein
LPRINSNLHLSQDGSPIDTFHIFFNSDILELIKKETKLYAEQQIRKKDKISGT